MLAVGSVYDTVTVPFAGLTVASVPPGQGGPVTLAGDAVAQPPAITASAMITNGALKNSITLSLPGNSCRRYDTSLLPLLLQIGKALCYRPTVVMVPHYGGASSGPIV